MPTIFTHAVAAAALGRSWARSPVPFRFWLLSASCAMLPDADVVGIAFGVDYGDMLGHRGLTHSLAFALCVGFAVVMLAFPGGETSTRRRLGLVAHFSVVTASHGALDALTDGGLGVAFFAPFEARRYFFPWRPIEVSPIGLGFFSGRGLEVLGSEVAWVWLPSLALVALAWGVRKLIKSRAT
ncbi:MAG TPA: metal-dependent hydrolase [Pyrinomonadaceae bacterium]|jgi:inner membrane protein|nr:metal-dependent hydrolase [Pyrinomonadaceae bacterium]